MTTQTGMENGEKSPSKIARVAALAYGTVAYLIFFGTLLYAIGFVGNIMVAKSIDTGMPGPFWPSVAINVALLGLFGLQHSVMARPEFKKRWTRIVPKPIERSTFVLFTCFAFALLFWMWQPMPGVVWQIDNPVASAAITALSMAGWLFVVLSTFMIHHFDLFGLRQVYTYLRGDRYRELGFRTPGVYKYLRHPIMLGFMVAFWSAPTMTEGRFLFAMVTTAYILVAIQLEERDLMRFHGPLYAEYRRRVRALLPIRKSSAADKVVAQTAGN
ncbi:MAG: isoprenylcysteine carboxylmethyltransferase family protein [Bryobacteraceae bacterium]|nr:isoprenylcysteine carboxylmethyltransferase family protein [Bryobacteraceae bacterium]